MITWLKRLFESRSHKEFKLARKDLHENRQEMQRAISSAMESRRQTAKVLKVAEDALKKLEQNRNGLKQ